MSSNREANSDNDVCKEQVFDKLFRTYSTDLYKILFYKFGEGLNPSDIVQEAFIRLWNNCQKVPLEKARGFLMTVANNLMLNSIARNKTVQKHSSEATERLDYQTPEFELESSEYSQQLEKALASLSEEQRVAFLLNRVEGKKHQEIADMLGISKKGVEKRIYTALAKIRSQLDYFK